MDLLELPKGHIEEIDIFPKSGYSQIVKKSDNIEIIVNKYEDIGFPIIKNQKIGTIEVFVNNKVAFKTDAIVKVDVKKGKWQTIFLRSIKNLFNKK